MSPSELRLKAAEIIEQRGWTKGMMLRDDGRCCMVGALALAVGATPGELEGRICTLPRSSWMAVNAALESMGFPQRGHAVHFNDCAYEPEEVLAKLREGIAS